MGRRTVDMPNQAEAQELREELERYDAKVAPLDDELAALEELKANAADRIEFAQAEYRIDQLQDERKPLWEERQRVARRYAVVQAVEDERRRRAERAERARQEIERTELKIRIAEIMSGEIHDLFHQLVPGGQIAGALPGGESTFGLLGRLVLRGRLSPDAPIHQQLRNELDRARRELAEAEEQV